MYCSSSMSCWSDHARAWASGQIHTWVSNVNLVPAIRSSSNSFVFLFLNAAIATIHQLNCSTRLSYPKTDTIVPARKTDLHLGLEVAFAFAFLVSSSICFWIWSSLFSSINNWLLNSTIAFLADSLWSLRPPPNQPIQDIVVVYLAKGEEVAWGLDVYCTDRLVVRLICSMIVASVLLLLDGWTGMIRVD